MTILRRELREMGLALPDEIGEQLAFRDDLGMDSLKVIEYIARLEQAFRVQVGDDEWRQLYTLGLVVDYVEERL
ncbi:MAG: acyl carrier protein [Ardenticatenaceae bacterium]